MNECKNFIELVDSNFPDVENIKENWNIIFYNNAQKDSSESLFIKNFCEKFGDSLKVAGVNCDENEDLCAKQEIHKIPTFNLYYGKGKKAKINLYQGLKPGFLVKQNIRNMENNVIRLNINNYSDFIKKNFGKRILILFTKRKNTGILYLSLANKLKEKVLFTEIHYKNPLAEKFNVTKYPSLLLLTDSLNYKGIDYENEKIDKNNIIHFLNEKAFKKNKDERIQELSKERFKLGNCGKKDKNFCVVILIDDKKKIRPIRNKLKELSEIFLNDNVTFYYMLHKKINKKIHKDSFEGENILILRGKRNKYVSVKGDFLSDGFKAVKDKVDNLLGGSLGSMIKYDSLESLFN